MILNLTNEKEEFSELVKSADNAQLLKSKFFNGAFSELNDEVILPLLRSSISTQVMFLHEIKTKIKQLMSRRRNNSIADVRPMTLTRPYVKISQKSQDAQRKKFTSVKQLH